MFGGLIAGKGQERQFNGRYKDYLRCLSEDMKAFGIESEGWTTKARDEVEWHSCVEQGAQRFLRTRRVQARSSTSLSFVHNGAHVGQINIYTIQLLRVKYEHPCVPDSDDTVQLVMGRSL